MGIINPKRNFNIKEIVTIIYTFLKKKKKSCNNLYLKNICNAKAIKDNKSNSVKRRVGDEINFRITFQKKNHFGANQFCKVVIFNYILLGLISCQI